MGDGQRPIEDVLFHEDTFTSMKFNMGKAPVATKIRPGSEDKRPLSSFSMRVDSPDAALQRKMAAENNRHLNSLSPPPAYYDAPPMYIEPHGSSRKQSPSTSRGSGSPMLHRSHSPFSECESPLPPVGNNLYHSEYITTPVPTSTTPHLPAPSPTIGRRS